MRVLLINPPIELMEGEVAAVVAPLGLAYIASVLEKAGHQVKILDCIAASWRHKIGHRFSPGSKYIRQYLADFQPQIVGISNLVAPTETESLRLAKLIKKILPKAIVVIGGSNASINYASLIKDQNVDVVAIGEGEMTMRELVGVIEKGSELTKICGLVFKDQRGRMVINPPRPLLFDLDQLPYPAWHLLPMKEYLQGHAPGVFIKKRRIATMVATRGCPNSCSFCTNERIWGRNWRKRSLANVMGEIKLLKKQYRIEEIQFVDNNISVDKKWFSQFCRALKKEKLSWLPAGGVAVLTLNPSLIKLMAESGCYALQFGIEHGDLAMQKRIGKVVPLPATQALVKACHQYGIWTHGNFVVGLPGETTVTAYRSLEYAIKADFDSISFFTALPLPGSRVYEEVFGRRQVDLKNLKFYRTTVSCSDLTPRQLKRIINDMFKQFMVFKIKRELRPLNFLRRLSQIKSWADLQFYWRVIGRFFQLENL